MSPTHQTMPMPPSAFIRNLKTVVHVALTAISLSSVVFSVVGLALLDVFWIGSGFLLLRVPVAIGCGLLLGIFWKRIGWVRRACLATTVALCASSFGVDVWRRPAPATLRANASTTLRVVSFNVLFVNKNHRKIERMIKNSHADVVLLQEITPAHERALGPKLKRLYPFQRWSPLYGAFGTAILAKHPLSAGTTMHLADGNRFAQCATLGNHVRRTAASGPPATVVCSVHLSSPAEAFPVRASGRFVKRLDRVAVRRADQNGVLINRIKRWEEEGLHVIVGGDFNTLEFEPVHRRMQQTLVDTFRSQRSSVGGTWPHGVVGGPFRYVGPAARIDYVFASGAFDVVDAQVLDNAGSDHAAVMATLRAKASVRHR